MWKDKQNRSQINRISLGRRKAPYCNNTSCLNFFINGKDFSEHTVPTTSMGTFPEISLQKYTWRICKLCKIFLPTVFIIRSIWLVFCSVMVRVDPSEILQMMKYMYVHGCVFVDRLVKTAVENLCTIFRFLKCILGKFKDISGTWSIFYWRKKGK